MELILTAIFDGRGTTRHTRLNQRVSYTKESVDRV